LLVGKLFKPLSNTIVIGKGPDALKFLVHPSKFFWTRWPPGMPTWIQEPVPALLYVEGNCEPLDPYDRKSLITPQSLHKISDEAMLKQTWKDVRDATGVAPKENKLLLILVVVAVAASAIAAVIAFMGLGQIGTIRQILGG
jgi:hypothetical protein